MKKDNVTSGHTESLVSFLIVKTTSYCSFMVYINFLQKDGGTTFKELYFV